MNKGVSDEVFKEMLEESKKAVFITAKYLSDNGYPITIQPTFVRPEYNERKKYTDNGDMLINFTIEAKHRPTLSFTCKEDFPYDTIIVDKKHIVDDRQVKPYAFFIWNKDYTCAIRIMVKDTFDKWITTKKFNTLEKRELTYYECPIDLIKFVKITDKSNDWLIGLDF